MKTLWFVKIIWYIFKYESEEKVFALQIQFSLISCAANKNLITLTIESTLYATNYSVYRSTLEKQQGVV